MYLLIYHNRYRVPVQYIVEFKDGVMQKDNGRLSLGFKLSGSGKHSIHRSAKPDEVGQQTFRLCNNLFKAEASTGLPQDVSL